MDELNTRLTQAEQTITNLERRVNAQQQTIATLLSILNALMAKAEELTSNPPTATPPSE